MKTQLCFLMALTSFLTVFSADLAFVKNPPVIDGSGKDPVWQARAWNSGFTTYKTHRKPQAETRFKIAYDRENLYCLIEAFEPSMKNLSLRKITTRIAEDFWMSDSVEILMRMQGFDVTVPSEQLAINEKKAEQRAKFQQLFADGKDVAQKALDDQVHKALDWLKEEENQEKLLNWGIAIAQLVLLKKLPQKK